MTNLDRIIQLVRENMVAGTGGFTGSADPKGPVAGFDPMMKLKKRYIKLVPGSRKRWQKDK
jgi:hypothetical protein